MPTYKDMRTRISALKVQLIVDHPFFGMFLSNTNIDRNDSIPTAATNGLSIWYNEKFFEALTDPEIKGVLLHEVFHMVYSHCNVKRRGTRERRLWNVAADYSLNWEIDEMDKESIKLPNNREINGKMFKACLDYKYKKMYAEQIYDILIKEQKDPGDMGFDIHIDMPMDEEQQQELEDRIVAAHELSKSRGKTPQGILRAVEEIRKSRIPWTRVFQRYLGNALVKDDYSYIQPNRRFLGQDIYLPSLLNYKVGRVLFAVDTSGSIGEPELAAFTNELKKVSALISEVVVASWDTKVHTWETVRNMDNIQKACKFAGGGGTEIQCVFNELARRRESFEVIIILTDGEYGPLPPKHTVKSPVIFVMTTNKKAEWGATVQMKL